MPIVNNSRMTPISAAWLTSSGSFDEPQRVRTDDDAGQEEADDRHETDAVREVRDDRRRHDQDDRFEHERLTGDSR